jgi:hypothetical protein
MGYAFVDHTADVAGDLTARRRASAHLGSPGAGRDHHRSVSVQPSVTQLVMLESGALDLLLVTG